MEDHPLLVLGPRLESERRLRAWGSIPRSSAESYPGSGGWGQFAKLIAVTIP